MKKSVKAVIIMLGIVAASVNFTSCQKEDVLEKQEKVAYEAQQENSKPFNVVTSEEYVGLSADEKKITDMMNSAIHGLKGMTVNGKPEINYTATIELNKGTKAAYDFVSISRDEISGERTEGNCTVCGILSAKDCIKAIIAQVDATGSATVTVKPLADGCYSVSY